MGSFSNGCEGLDYQERYCFKCRNYRDLGDGCGPCCPIWDVHLLYCSAANHHEQAAQSLGAREVVLPVDGPDMDEPEVHGEHGNIIFQRQRRWTVDLHALRWTLDTLIPHDGCHNGECAMFNPEPPITTPLFEEATP